MVHRARMPKKTWGPPRDIIAKFHYYRTKEQILEAAREKDNLLFQGYNYQILSDISQLSISKRRAMKPLLLELQHHKIKYQWRFPFSLRFTYQGTKITCRTPDQLQQALLDLKLIEGAATATTSRRRSASASSHNNLPQHGMNNGTQIRIPTLGPRRYNGLTDHHKNFLIFLFASAKLFGKGKYSSSNDFFPQKEISITLRARFTAEIRRSISDTPLYLSEYLCD